MIWIDPSAQFRRRFQRCDQGFLYYPKRKGGGKIITQAEHDVIVGNFRRWFGARFRPGLSLAAMFGLIVVITLVSLAFPLSERAFDVAIWIVAATFLLGYYWLYSAPQRLVKDRPEVTPPRTREELGRAGRAMMTWPMVVFAIGLCSLAVFVGVSARPNIATVIWTVFWVIVLAVHVRNAVRKFQDRRG